MEIKKITIATANLGMRQALEKSNKEGTITQAEYERYINGDFDRDKCVVSGYKPNKAAPNNYTQVRVEKLKYYCHRIAVVWLLQHDVPMDIQVSHSCNNPPCYNPLHMIVTDSDDVNRSRMCCRLFKHLVNYRCPHQPSCNGVLPVESYEIKQ